VHIHALPRIQVVADSVHITRDAEVHLHIVIEPVCVGRVVVVAVVSMAVCVTVYVYHVWRKRDVGGTVASSVRVSVQLLGHWCEWVAEIAR
jgi:hypothetical protein